jgi:CubicO group peptidase (beta-lactamase class C family)
MLKLLILSLSLTLTLAWRQVHAQATATVPSSFQATGYNGFISHRHFMKPVGPVRELLRDSLTSDQQRVADQAAQLAQNPSLLSIVLVERGKIIYEHYNEPARADRWFYSWSMSKSLTAYTLGTALCNGRISNLDTPAGQLSPELLGTVHGEATVRDSLMMASGVKDAQQDGEYRSGVWLQIVQQSYSGQEYLRDHSTRGQGFFGAAKSGSTFNYKNIDTTALESVVEARGGFLRQFQENIWSKVGAERGASWVLDKDKRAVAYAGFTAHTRDWARLAMWSIDQIKGDDSCMRDFMQAATRSQISNHTNTGRSFKSYGYQTYIGNFGPRDSYWWVGHGGQRVGIDPKTERIIVVSSWREDYMDQIYNLFGQWQRN